MGELLAELEGREPLALLHDQGRGIDRPHPHEKVNVVRLKGQLQYLPAVFLALPFNELLAGRFDLSHQDGLTPLGCPDEMIHNEVDAMFVPSVFHTYSVDNN